MIEHLKYMAEVRPGEDGLAAAWAVAEIETLRQQWCQAVGTILEQVIENKKILDDASARLDRIRHESIRQRTP